MFEEYAKKRDHWCDPKKRMTAITFSDAKTECSENVSCNMFYHFKGTGNKFYACENTASIKESTSGSILYQGNHHIHHSKVLVLFLKNMLIVSLCTYG